MKKLVQSICFALMVKVSALLKVSFIVGSWVLWFSASSVLLPLSGAFGGIFTSCIVFMMRIFMHVLFFKTLSVSFLALCVPGLCASLYFATRSSIIRLFLPILCMILFIIHPVGSQALIYSFYWLVPIVLYFMKRDSFFIHALGSTFVAHAVGSVIWLYTVPMTPAMWLQLIPIVAIERLSFAAGMVVMYNAALLIKGLPINLVVRRRIFPLVTQ